MNWIFKLESTTLDDLWMKRFNLNEMDTNIEQAVLKKYKNLKIDSLSEQ